MRKYGTYIYSMYQSRICNNRFFFNKQFSFPENFVDKKVGNRTNEDHFYYLYQFLKVVYRGSPTSTVSTSTISTSMNFIAIAQCSGKPMFFPVPVFTNFCIL